MEKVREDIVGGPSIVLTRKTVVYKTFFESIRTCANQLLGFMPANYTPTRCVNLCRHDLTCVGITISRQLGAHFEKTATAALKIGSCLIFNEQDQNIGLKASIQKAGRKRIDTSSVDGSSFYDYTDFQAMGRFHHFYPFQEVRPSLTAQVNKRGSKKKELDEMRRSCLQEKGFTVITK